ncbi:uncharacterized protein PAC_17534 [Phialocephala subalpina]|uniref:Uncharacterized protein n=1 Tax=Phialocephala subalpina TaxID=576137 RepID=A0A1L7XRK6_9HELO|nr:uncharacterized protein PAC_17534 [Phialocephala subalpina]
MPRTQFAELTSSTKTNIMPQLQHQEQVYVMRDADLESRRKSFANMNIFMLGCTALTTPRSTTQLSQVQARTIRSPIHVIGSRSVGSDCCKDARWWSRCTLPHSQRGLAEMRLTISAYVMSVQCLPALTRDQGVECPSGAEAGREVTGVRSSYFFSSDPIPGVVSGMRGADEIMMMRLDEVGCWIVVYFVLQEV